MLFDGLRDTAVRRYRLRRMGLQGAFVGLMVMLTFFGDGQTGIFAQTYTVGSGTGTNSSTSYPAGFGNYYYGAKQQFLVLASELQNAGASSGYITDLAFDVTSTSGASAHEGYVIKIRNTSTTSLGTTFETGLTQVFGPQTVTPTIGWNTFTFGNSFFWDGVSNLIIETCFNNNGFTLNPLTRWTSYGYNASIVYRADNATNCVQTAQNYSSNKTRKPNMRFSITPPVNDDAGISALTAPAAPVGAGQQNVSVTLFNFGLNALTSVTIDWEVDGTAQTAVNWTGNLAPGGSTTVSLGDFTFAAGGTHSFTATTSNPNNTSDNNTDNDSFSMDINVAMGGVYTIGGANPDFATIAEAVAELKERGVASITTFNIRPGTYTTRVEINAISGASQTNSITFQSESVNPDDVTLQNQGFSSLTNYVIKLNGADWIVFKNLSFKALGSTYSRIIEITGGSDHVSIINNTFWGNTSNSTSTLRAHIYASGTLNHYFTAQDNTFNDGSSALYFLGINTSSGNKSIGTRIVNNTMNNQYYAGAFTRYLEDPTISGNTISTNKIYTSFYGIYTYYSEGQIVIKDNSISGARGRYGIYSYRNNGDASGSSIIANNMVQFGYAHLSNNSWGIYVYYNNNMTVAFNSFLLNGNTTSNRAAYLCFGTNNRFYNNIARARLGHAVYLRGTAFEMDRNNYYTTGTNLGYYNGNRTTLAAFQSATGKDANSYNVEPGFAGEFDLHTDNETFNGAAMPLANVGHDIDGDVRNPVAPDIGADEFTPQGLDAAIAWVSPVRPAAGGLNNVVVQIANLRSTPITSVEITYTDGSNPVTQNFSGLSIAPEGVQTLTFDTPYNLIGIATLNAQINSVNNGADDVASNNNVGPIDLAPALDGDYTVGAPTDDFSSIQEALQALELGGAFAPVTFNISSGTYLGQFDLNPFSGASPNNTVTIQAANGDASSVVFQAISTSSVNRHTIRLNDNAEYYILNNVTINGPTSGSYSYTLTFAANVKNITVQNCVIDARMFSTSSNFRTIAFNPTSRNHENIYIRNNTVRGGYYGMYLFGNFSGRNKNIQVTGNTVQDFRLYGIYFYGMEGGLIADNDISRPTRTSLSSFYGVYLSGNSNTTVIENNKFHNVAPSAGFYTTYALYVTSCDAPAGLENIARNNAFYNLNTRSTLRAIYNSSSDGFFAYNNSISLDDAGTSSSSISAGFYQSSTAQRIKFRNNIVSITRGGSGQKYGVYYSSTGSDIESNNNLFNINGPSGINYIGRWGGSSQTTLSGWQGVSGKDPNSLLGDPLFVTPNGNLNIAQNSPAANFNGVALADVPTDINGNTRSVPYPDMGAYNSPATLYASVGADFGNVGRPADLSIAVENTSGHEAITINSTSFNGSGAGSFETTPFNLPTPKSGDRKQLQSSSVAPNGSVSGGIQFGLQGASQPGQQNALLTFNHSGGNNPYSVPVTGYYAGATAIDTENGVDLLAPNSKFDVGGVLLGGTPTSRSFTLAPDITPLDEPIEVTGIALTGEDGALFSVSTVPRELTGDLLVAVTLSPLGATPGSKKAFLEISHTGANGPVTKIRIEGKVGRPLLGAPALVDLPFAVLGESYDSQYDNVMLIPLTRAGLVDVEIYSLPSLTGSGAGQIELLSSNGKHFLRGAFGGGGKAIVAGNGLLTDPLNWAGASASSPIVITDSQPWFLVVRLKEPVEGIAQGSYNAELLLADGSGKGTSNAENLVNITLIGQVISDPALLAFFPFQLNFGPNAVGTKLRKTLIVRNQSGIAGDVQLSLNGRDFSFEGGAKSLRIAMPADNEPAFVGVEYAPSSAGFRSGLISFSGVIEGAVSLSGTGLASNAGSVVYEVNGVPIKETVEFGDVALGKVGVKTVRIVNWNVGPVTITNIARSGANATQFSVTGMAFPTTIAGNGGSATFDVNFVPTSTSKPTKKALLTVMHDAGVSKLINIRGNATLTDGGTVDVSLTPTRYNFGSVSGSYDFVLTNDGSSAVTVVAAVILGSSNFSVSGPLAGFPITVAANGGSASFTAEFDASFGANGVRSGSLLLITPGHSPFPTAGLIGTVNGTGGSGDNITARPGFAVEPVIALEGVYPHPVRSKAEIRYTITESVGNVTVVVYDLEGREALRILQGAQNSGLHSVALDAETLSAGQYYYVIEAGDQLSGGSLTVVK